MDIDEIQKKLNEIIQRYSGNIQIDSYYGKSLVSDIKLDSVSLMEVISDIEDEFGFRFGLDENLIELFDNYDRLLEYMRKRMERADDK